ncbi:NAD-dependent protein deacetylase sirtuin-1-like isoform X2 [Tachypleus tridentatus]|uniref:NAD-dependent protein deacetylase sirtuin-1-like isoform X2 n=1 Tax=Tachypleus tridentatus TaxID=6853 RepID=UPI003FD2A198
MAEGCANLCDFPVYKRPRLENEESITSNGDLEHHSLLSVEQAKSCTDTASSNGVEDFHENVWGSDSGFHDLTPPINDDYQEHSPLEYFMNGTSLPKGEDNQQDTQTLVPSLDSSIIPRAQPSKQECIEESLKYHDEDEDDEVASTVSNLSGLSDLSGLSGQEWKSVSGPVTWVQQQIMQGVDPRIILEELVPQSTFIPPYLDPLTMWKIIVSMLNEPPRRTKLLHVNTIDDVVNLIQTSQNIMVLTGAGVSVSCGIPDFRSRNGIYARLSKDFPELPDPQAMFDIHYFRKDPRPFFKFAKEIYPGQFQPSPSHRFIRLIEEHGKLLRNYTQNIDTLEYAAGIKRAITCHGSFATATCTKCEYKVDSTVIKEDIFNQTIPSCPMCPKDSDGLAVMKPDIVFFGEGLSDEFHQTMARDKNQCDLLIVMGSSLKVRPVALIPSSIPSEVPQILINRERLKHLSFDVELLGDCDVIVQELCRRLGSSWSEIVEQDTPMQELTDLPEYHPKQHPPTCNIPPPPECSSHSSEEVEVICKTGENSASSKPNGWLGSCQLCSAQPFTEEESTCSECNGLSNIHLEDSQDGAVPGSDTSHQSNLGGKELEDLQTYWHSKSTDSLSVKLPDHSFLFISPNRYIFRGAEEYLQNSSDVDSCQDNDQFSESDSESSSQSPPHRGGGQ